MKKRQIILAAILIILGVGTVLFPEKDNREETPAQKLLQELNDNTRNKKPIFVAQLIINKDPSYLLVDVRSPEEYATFSLPGSINIPLEELNNSEYADYLNPVSRNIIFISNGGLKANQAWMLGLRKGYTNNYIMEGGINNWMRTIMRPEPPAETAPEEAIAEYNRCKAASMYFGGGNIEITQDVERKSLPVQRRKKERTIAGGC